MFKMRVVLLGVLALLVTSGIAASTASATGPYWRVAGARLEKGAKQIKLQLKDKAVLVAETNPEPLRIECSKSISEGATIEGNGTSQGQDKGRISFTSCTTSLKECGVVEPIATKPTKSYLATATTQTKIVDVFEPTEGDKYVEITLKGKCASLPIGTPEPVTGAVVAELIPAGKESPEGQMVFPEKPIMEVKHEGTTVNIERLKFATIPSGLSAGYGVRLATGERYGVFET